MATKPHDPAAVVCKCGKVVGAHTGRERRACWASKDDWSDVEIPTS